MLYRTIFVGLLSTMTACTSAFVVGGERGTSSSSSSALGAVTKDKATEKDVRKPWEVLRFISQSSKFVPTPFQSTPSRRTVNHGDVLWKPEQRNEFQFAPLDDVVMGGASSSNFDVTTGTWRGKVTDANNGGFVGIRNTPYVNWDMSKCRGIELYLRRTNDKTKAGRFKLGLRDSTEFNGIVWADSVDVKGGKGATKVRVPLSKLKPTKFASVVRDGSADSFRKDNVVGLQLVYSKFEYDGALNPKFEIGDIDLQILEIKAY